MGFRRSVAAGLSAIAVAAVGASGGAAQSPSVSPSPGIVACPAMTATSSSLSEPGAVLTGAFGAQDPAYPNPDPAYTGRFHPGEDWAYPDGSGEEPVVAIGNGTVLAVGSIGAGDRGGIVVVEHEGPFTVPASAAGVPWSYPAQAVDTIVSVYQGLDPAPGLVVGSCVDPIVPLGTLTAQCGPDVAQPCSDRPSQLHLEIRLPSTRDPAMHSADWSTVGPATASSDGYFEDPQEMVDLGLREPSAFLASVAGPCPAVSPAPSTASDPGAPTLPCPEDRPDPSVVPSPIPGPTPEPIRSPQAALLAGVPATIRDTCERRPTDRLVTGTIAAVDCHPDSGRIALVSYYLLRPADARFVFSSRMRQYELGKGADCGAGKPGIESAGANLSIGCFVDEDARANLRFASRKTCPAIYTGVRGTGRDIAALSRAFETSVGGQWQDPGSSLAACRSDTGKVSAPPAPSSVVFEVHTPADASFPLKPYRLEVSWDQDVDADTTIEVWAVTTCPRRSGSRSSGRCLTGQTPLPASIRQLVAKAPAGDGSVSWTVPAWEVDYGPVALDGDIEYWAVVVRAVNAHGKSDFVIATNGNGEFCEDCTA